MAIQEICGQCGRWRIMNNLINNKMKNVRIMPRLDVKGPNVVKPVHTEALRIVGDPKVLARKYYEEGADEIVYLDIVASLYQRHIDFDLLKSVTEGIFIPVTVGGGIRSISDIKNALRAGADKVAINTYAINHPEFIHQAVQEFGAQCIVLFIEAKKQPNEMWEAYTDGGREHTGINAIDWAKQGIELGVGEIFLCSIDQEGMRQGYDIELVEQIASIAPIPVIAHGGAGTLSSIKDVIKTGKADAVAASSIFHYGDYTINQVKQYLHGNNVEVRIV